MEMIIDKNLALDNDMDRNIHTINQQNISDLWLGLSKQQEQIKESAQISILSCALNFHVRGILV